MQLRLFIAVELPDHWITALIEAAHMLRRQGLERLRWVRPEGVHLTLKFLGNVEQERVAAIEGAMSAAARGVAPFTLTLGGAGVFGRPGRPRVVWAGVDGELASLTRLWQAVERHVGPLGFPPERERFSPHLTLARVPEDVPREVATAVEPALTRLRLPSAPALLVSEVSLMRSEPAAGGARYTRLAVAELQGKSPTSGHVP
jgi:2'-5' RNA ligase